MFRVIFVLTAAWVAAVQAASADAQLTLSPIDPPASGRNLAPNPSFELVESGLPQGWVMQARNTDAQAVVDETVAHSGRCSVKLTNGTPLGAFGRLALVQDIPVEPDTYYTLSCSYRTVDGGQVWVGGGRDWFVRLGPHQTHGRWMRFVDKPFLTAPDQTTFELMVVTESPTAGVWIDDIKLEKGQSATPFDYEDSTGRTGIWLDEVSQAFHRGQLQIEGFLSLPEDAGHVSVSVQASLNGHPIATAETPGPVPGGQSRLSFVFHLRPHAEGACQVRADLVDAAGRVIASSTQSLDLTSQRAVERRLQSVKARAGRLRGELERIGPNDDRAPYLRGDLAVVDRFVGLTATDIARGQWVRANVRVSDLLTLLDESLARVRDTDSVMVRRLQVEPDTSEPTRCGYGLFTGEPGDLEMVAEAGMGSVLVEVSPHRLLWWDRKLRPERVSDLVATLDAAAAEGLTVDVLVAWYELPAWMSRNLGPGMERRDGQTGFPIPVEGARVEVEGFIRQIAPVVASHPAVGSFVLADTVLHYDMPRAFQVGPDYAQWLLGRYGDLDAVARAHGTHYVDLLGAPILHDPDRPVATGRARLDFLDFERERWANWYGWMAGAIHDAAPGATVRVQGVSGTALGAGPQEAMLAAVQSAPGGPRAAEVFPRGRGHSPVAEAALRVDMARCFGDAAPTVCGVPVAAEWAGAEGGGSRLYAACWLSAIHGAEAVTVWKWGDDFDRWDPTLGALMERPATAVAVSRVAIDLRELAAEVRCLRAAPARVGLLCSWTSIGSDPSAYGALLDAYEALGYSGEAVDLISESRLASGRTLPYEVLIAPRVDRLPSASHEGLRSVLHAGGRVIAVGPDCLSHDEFGHRLPTMRHANLIRLAPSSPEDLRRMLVPRLAALPGGPMMRVIGTGSGEAPWGVAWRVVQEAEGRSTLVSLVNHTDQPAEVRLEGADGMRLTELPARTPTCPTVRLGPWDTAILRASP